MVQKQIDDEDKDFSHVQASVSEVPIEQVQAALAEGVPVKVIPQRQNHTETVYSFRKIGGKLHPLVSSSPVLVVDLIAFQVEDDPETVESFIQSLSVEGLKQFSAYEEILRIRIAMSPVLEIDGKSQVLANVFGYNNAIELD